MTRTVLAAAIVTALTFGTAAADDHHDDHDDNGHQHHGHHHHVHVPHFHIVVPRRPIDRFAVMKVVNTTDVVLNFEYRIGSGPWQSAMLRPGQAYGVYANFNFPGSYRHDPIEIRFDDDLRNGQEHWRRFLPYVRYSPSVNYRQAYEYHFAYSSPSRQSVEMHPAS